MNLLPAIVINRKFNDKSSLSFSFSKRIQRPSAAEMNPFVDRSNPNFIVTGNPYLRPISSDVYQLGYLISAEATLNVSLGAMFFNDVFNAIPFYDTTTNITLTRNENYGKGRVLKINISLSYPITPNWTFMLNSDIRHVKVSGAANSIIIKGSGFNAYV